MPKLFRVRYMPYEIAELPSDRILFQDSRYMITSWKPIRPRNDIKSGISLIFIDEGWKISAIKDAQDKIIYWYCDIIDVRHDSDNDAFYFHDLLVDIVFRDRRLEVLDLDELAEAFEQGLITKEELMLALRRCNSLLQAAYRMDVPAYATDMIRRLAQEESNVL